FFFHDTVTTEIYTLSLHDALPICGGCEIAMACTMRLASENAKLGQPEVKLGIIPGYGGTQRLLRLVGKGRAMQLVLAGEMISAQDRKSTRLNSSHVSISYAVFCLK